MCRYVYAIVLFAICEKLNVGKIHYIATLLSVWGMCGVCVNIPFKYVGFQKKTDPVT